MIADTLLGVHAMADKIGERRQWFQNAASFPHYDVCKSKRELAIQSGAVVLDRKELVITLQRLRSELAKGTYA